MRSFVAETQKVIIVVFLHSTMILVMIGRIRTMKPIDADGVYDWYVKAFSEEKLGDRAVNPNECRFSMNDITGNMGNIQKLTIPAILQSVTEEMCSNYCKYPEIWSSWGRGEELCESDICKNCPMNMLT